MGESNRPEWVGMLRFRHTENLFMDNIKDCAYLLTEEGRDLLAQIHINAIDEFLGYNDSQER